MTFCSRATLISLYSCRNNLSACFNWTANTTIKQNKVKNEKVAVVIPTKPEQLLLLIIKTQQIHTN